MKDRLAGILTFAIRMEMGTLLFDLLTDRLAWLDKESVHVIRNISRAEPFTVCELYWSNNNNKSDQFNCHRAVKGKVQKRKKKKNCQRSIEFTSFRNVKYLHDNLYTST